MNQKLRLAILLLIIAAGIYGCLKIFKQNEDIVLSIFKSYTPRELFLRKMKKADFLSETLLNQWDSVYQNAKSDSLQISLPYREIIVSDTLLKNNVYVWRFNLPGGRKVRIRSLNPLQNLAFAELYGLEQNQSDNPPEKMPVAVWDTVSQEIIFENKFADDDSFLFMVQFLPDTLGRVEFQFQTAPVLHFPVAEKDSRSILSFWGARRDGGRRLHEGNDVFAKRGTALLAVTEGYVSSTRIGGRGGKTVWLRDGEGRRLVYYYAHLDSQMVRHGDYVQRGDTVGTVGNTGNARNTKPHLHFGIYRRGARDPLPFLKNADKLPKKPRFNIENFGEKKVVPKRGKHFLRTGPEKRGTEIRQLNAEEIVTLLGVAGRFFRVRTERGELGFANFN